MVLYSLPKTLRRLIAAFLSTVTATFTRGTRSQIAAVVWVSRTVEGRRDSLVPLRLKYKVSLNVEDWLIKAYCYCCGSNVVLLLGTIRSSIKPELGSCVKTTTLSEV